MGHKRGEIVSHLSFIICHLSFIYHLSFVRQSTVAQSDDCKMSPAKFLLSVTCNLLNASKGGA